MPKIALNGASIDYQLCGDGPETVVLAHGLLLSQRIFADQLEALSRWYRCLAFDFRGHGQSSVPRTGYDLEQLEADTVGLIQALKAAPCHFVGLSLGGIIGLRLAIRRPELLRSLVVLSATPDAEAPANKKRYRLLALVALIFGLRVVVDQLMPVMFGRSFLSDPNRVELKRRWRQNLAANRRLGAARAVAAFLKRGAVYDQLGSIALPTLIGVGEEDTAAAKGEARRICSRIEGSRLVEIPRAGHVVTIEGPDAVNGMLADFWRDAGVRAAPPAG
jgi:3-oxoadipate enol-lactonase